MSARPRVLLADDHPGIVKALGRVLSFECDIVGVIADGREVGDAVAQLQPVVAVVDVNLPNVSGLDICRQITQTTRRAKVIIITAMLDDDIREAALKAGASGFLQKSSAMGDELIVAVKRVWTGVLAVPVFRDDAR